MGNDKYNVYLLTRNDTLGVEEWMFVGIVHTWWYEDNILKCSGNDEFHCVVPIDRVFKIEKIK